MGDVFETKYGTTKEAAPLGAMDGVPITGYQLRNDYAIRLKIIRLASCGSEDRVIQLDNIASLKQCIAHLEKEFVWDDGATARGESARNPT